MSKFETVYCTKTKIQHVRNVQQNILLTVSGVHRLVVEGNASAGLHVLKPPHLNNYNQVVEGNKSSSDQGCKIPTWKAL